MELEHLSLQLVDPLGRGGSGLREHLVFQFADIALEPVQYCRVVVDHPVEDRQEHGTRSVAELLGLVFQRFADGDQFGGLAMANRDDESLIDEEKDLPSSTTSTGST